MPISNETIEFSSYDYTGFGYIPKPLAALTCTSRHNVANPKNCLEAAREAEDKLSIASAVLNCLPGVICIPSFATSYSPEHVPPGFFGGGGGSYWVEQALPRLTVDFADGHLQTLASDSIGAISDLPTKYQEQIRAALERFAQAKATSDKQKRALDLGIALEMVLLYSENKIEIPNQLALSFRTRGAWIAGEDLDDRKNIYNTLNMIYSQRSQVAHNGEIDYKKLTHPEIIKAQTNNIEIAERIFQKLILTGCAPNWKEVILGGHACN